MSEQQYYIEIKKELGRLNKIIDSKILAGKNYSFEARKHMMIREMVRKSQSNIKKSKKGFNLFAILTSKV